MKPDLIVELWYRIELGAAWLSGLFSNLRWAVRRGPKKDPPQRGTGIEYGGHHLP